MNIVKKRLRRMLKASSEPNWKALISDIFDSNIDELDNNTWSKLKEIAEKDHRDPQPLMSESDYQLIKNTSLDSFKNSLKKDFISVGLQMIENSKKIKDETGYVPKNEMYHFIKQYDMDFFGGWIENSNNKLLWADFPADEDLNYIDTLDINIADGIIYPFVGHDYDDGGPSRENFWNAYDTYFNVH